ncbi:MAG TPA: ABC transporter permease [Acidimicrobiales bacterium]|nr:ABC transporter permease [Acidimicrobiales bacterium]
MTPAVTSDPPAKLEAAVVEPAKEADAARPSFPPIGWVGAGIVGFFAVVALAGPWIAPFRPEELAASGLEHPSGRHLLGTTPIGQDLFSQLVLGARASLLMAVLAGAGAVAVGTAIGVAAGWMGGLVDAALMRLVDVVLAFPRLPLLMLLGAYVGGSIPVVAVIISLLFWPGTARIVRAQVQSLRRRAHVRSAVGFGAGSAHVLRHHVAPELALVLVASLVGAAGRAIILEAGLAFLGLGDPARTSWGSMIREARAVGGIFYTNLWVWWMLPPVLAIMAVMLGMTFLGVGFERRLNPHLARHVSVAR